MSDTLTLPILWRLLETRGEGVLATIRSNGRPQLSNIGYVYDPELRVARFIAADFRAKTRNLRRDPRASLHVTSPDFRTWVVAEGEVTISEPAVGPGEEVYDEILTEFYEAIGAPATPEHLEAYPIIGRSILRLRVERIYGGEGSKALGINSNDEAVRA